ncbi:nuclear transport factor 2 family protein [Massilia sp. ST3]|uniref:nuclear transport factor 2 family protein n=1 Tax=Massilia sp. ST3 TaxID=2824903 RepID=UPI001B840A8A|nr:nuclear transport factor 2 family protein [Massilia sp. ST3]MBQ5947004.1 nuclear transport factor 2 family protein [Massilia sp. ST3]
MKRFLTACFLFLGLFGLANAETDPALTRQVNAFVDEWHEDAANARMAYFDKMAKEGVYIGTDRTELWKRDEFKAWARKYFERKSAWSFKATRRNVYASADGSIIWFDELLDTPNMGPCMASGVIRKTKNGFEILHYQLSMAVPNEVNGQVRKLIDESAKKAKS